MLVSRPNKKKILIEITKVGLLCILLSSMIGCQNAPLSTPVQAQKSPQIKVLAVESFLADIAKNISGDRLEIDSLIPMGMDPHSFEPTPKDVVKISESSVLIINGNGLEDWLNHTLQNAGGKEMVIQSSAGLTARKPGTFESPDPEHTQGDPHFWLDPNNVVRYVENIEEGLSKADPAGKEIYAQNAQIYIQKLRDLDQWITEQVITIPPEKRLLVTNHESLGYFADRYQFKIIGTVIPSISTNSSPSALQVAQLIDRIRQSSATAIFLETGANPQLAVQISDETHVKVVSDLYTHSISNPDGPAPTYIAMMKYDVNLIVSVLK